MRLSIFAGHVGNIMETDAPAQFALSPCHGVRADIKIVPAHHGLGKVWDTVYLNGKCCGNRYGGVQEFTALVCAAQPQVAYT